MDVDVWIKTKAIPILRSMGIKEGQYILDFGSGSGVYTKLISKIVGEKGKVYALDCDEDKINKLKKEIEIQRVKNVKFIITSKNISIPIEDTSVDVVIGYDVYHLLNDSQRNNLISEIYRILKNGGFLSLSITHLSDYNYDLKPIHSQIQAHNLILIENFRKLMFHWSWIEECQIFNYYKGNSIV